MKDLLKRLQEYREMHGHIEMMEADGNYIFSEIYDLVNDYVAEQLFKDRLAKMNLRHFEVGGIDWYVEVYFHEGQEQTYDQPHIDDQWEIGDIYTSNMEKLDTSCDLWQFIADEIENFHL